MTPFCHHWWRSLFRNPWSPHSETSWTAPLGNFTSGRSRGVPRIREKAI